MEEIKNVDELTCVEQDDDTNVCLLETKDGDEEIVTGVAKLKADADMIEDRKGDQSGGSGTFSFSQPATCSVDGSPSTETIVDCTPTDPPV